MKVFRIAFICAICLFMASPAISRGRMSGIRTGRGGIRVGFVNHLPDMSKWYIEHSPSLADYMSCRDSLFESYEIFVSVKVRMAQYLDEHEELDSAWTEASNEYNEIRDQLYDCQVSRTTETTGSSGFVDVSEDVVVTETDVTTGASYTHIEVDVFEEECEEPATRQIMYACNDDCQDELNIYQYNTEYINSFFSEEEYWQTRIENLQNRTEWFQLQLDACLAVPSTPETPSVPPVGTGCVVNCD